MSAYDIEYNATTRSGFLSRRASQSPSLSNVLEEDEENVVLAQKDCAGSDSTYSLSKLTFILNTKEFKINF